MEPIPTVMDPQPIPVELAPNQVPPGVHVAQAQVIPDDLGAGAQLPAQTPATSQQQKRRADIFGKACYRSSPTPAAPRKSARTQEPTTTTSPSGQQQINVPTRQQVHEKLAKGGWGELCAEFLRERGVLLLPVPLLERQHLLAQDVAGAADDQPLMADAMLLVARAPLRLTRPIGRFRTYI